MAREIFSIKSIKEKKFQTMELCPEYAYLMGHPEKRFTGIHYGESGSGKSVLTLKFADYFAKKLRKSAVQFARREDKPDDSGSD